MNDKALREGPPVLLFLDYDGTIVPFMDIPSRAVLAAGRREFLSSLARKNWLCIVSGRSLAEIRRLVGLSGIAYIGNHGLEMHWGGRTWVHPRAPRFRPDLERVLERIRRHSGAFPARLVEDKSLTASIHYRGLRPRDREKLLDIVRAALRPAPSLKLVLGNKVMEIRPRISWDKGRAVARVRKRVTRGRRTLTVYLGDDRTDEDAFRTLRNRGLTFRVGGKGATQALGRLPDVASVWRFLRAFL